MNHRFTDRLAEALNLIPVGPAREAAIVAFHEVFAELYIFVREDMTVDVVAND